jgi:uncharacterized protein DUF6059
MNPGKLWRSLFNAFVQANIWASPLPIAGYYRFIPVPPRHDQPQDDGPPAVEAPAAPHPERLVLDAELSEQERRYWRRLAKDLETPHSN